MTITKEQVRGALIASLAKEGSTIKEAEEKMTKQALGFKDSLTGIKGLAQLLLGSAGVAGGLGGIGLYGGYRMLENSDDKMREALEVKQRLQKAQQELEAVKLQQQTSFQ